MSSIVAFPPKMPEDRARALKLQEASDRMLVIAAELDKIRAALAGEGAEMTKAMAVTAGR